MSDAGWWETQNPVTLTVSPPTVVTYSSPPPSPPLARPNHGMGVEWGESYRLWLVYCWCGWASTVKASPADHSSAIAQAFRNHLDQ